MNENTCFANPPKEPLVMIRYWHLTACDGNACAAALLSYFDYWHSYKLNEYNQNRKKNDVAQQHGDSRTQDESLYQFHTDQELVNALFGLFKEDKIREAINLLKEKRFITVTKNPNPKYKFDRTNFYLLNVGELLPVLEAYNELDYEDRVHQWDVKPKGKRKSEDDLRNIVDGQRNIVDDSRNIVEQYHEITSEITTETTLNTLSSQSSDRNLENNSLNLSQPEKVGTISGNNTAIAILPDAEHKPKKVMKSPEPKKPKRELVKEKTNDPEFIRFFEQLRNKYTLFSGNKFLKYFSSHRQQFYKTVAYRVANEEVSKELVEKAFEAMSTNNDFSIIQFLGEMKTEKYSDSKILVDFIWIMTDGKVSAPTLERKGAKELAEWVGDSRTTLTEIEDCFLWMPISGRSYGRSLMAVKAALKEFDVVKMLGTNGRFTGTSINGGYKTKEEKTLETLKQRDYDQSATDILAAEAAQKEYMKQLINGTK